MNDLTNHGVPRAFQLLWRRRPRVAAASWCKRRYGREREWRSRVGLTECGSSTSVDRNALLDLLFSIHGGAWRVAQEAACPLPPPPLSLLSVSMKYSPICII